MRLFDLLQSPTAHWQTLTSTSVAEKLKPSVSRSCSLSLYVLCGVVTREKHRLASFRTWMDRTITLLSTDLGWREIESIRSDDPMVLQHHTRFVMTLHLCLAAFMTY